MRFARFAQANAWLEGHIDFEKVAPNRSDIPTLQPIHDTLAALADPHHDYPKIHVTGTNGKGTTTTLISNLLHEWGLSVGTFVSPDLHRVNERILLNGEPVRDEQFTMLISRLADVETATGIVLTRFELLTVAAFLHFSDMGVDVAVIEVGMGGTWDSTNVIDADVSVLTNVSLDHTPVLGNSVGEIASDKVGIFRASGIAVLGTIDETVVAIAETRVAELGSPLIRLGRDFALERNNLAVGGRMLDLHTPMGEYHQVLLTLHGIHQGMNALTALVATETFLGRAITEDVVEAVFGLASMAGRMEVLEHYPLIMIDGAHNPAGVISLAETLEEAFHLAGQRRVVLGMLTGREIADMIEPLVAIGVDEFIVCEPISPRTQKADIIAEYIVSRGAHATVVLDPREAVRHARELSGEDDQIIVAGSLYLVGDVRAGLLALPHQHR